MWLAWLSLGVWGAQAGAQESDPAVSNTEEVLETDRIVWETLPVTVVKGQPAVAELRIVLPPPVAHMHYALGADPASDAAPVEVLPSTVHGLWERAEGEPAPPITLKLPIDAVQVETGIYRLGLHAWLRACVSNRCVEVRDVPVDLLVQVVSPTGAQARPAVQR